MDRRWLCLVGALAVGACSDIPVNHDTAERCGCVAEPVSVTPLDMPIRSTTTVSPCRTFSFSVDAFGDRAAASCSMPMLCPAQPGGGNAIAAPQATGVHVAEAVAHPDVQAALRAAPIRYGAGPGTPGGGGPVYRLGVGSAEFEVAGPCGSEPCTPTPEGVQRLLERLLAVGAQELNRTPCREIVNP